ncbi:hypothetical protein AB0K00_50200 [Dactylosporangium sp. NPDC049525]|uniref:hypothetical protein n=1 Tax=Dactylosporangium sp. NPDC049525 TaxID=3154730 RepID=UPI00342042D8
MLQPSEPATTPGGDGLPTIPRAQLAGLTAGELLARATSPTVRMMGVVSLDGRKEVVRRLDTVRSALFGYWILFIHGRHALTGFCAELPHRTVDPDFWTLLDRSLSELDDQEMLAITRRFRAEIERAQAALAAAETGTGTREWDWERTAAMLLLLDPQTMRQLDEDYRRADAASLDGVAGYIRRHADEVFVVTDGSENVT